MSIRNQAYYSSTTPPTINGPWRIGGVGVADPIGPGNSNVLISTDPGCSTVFSIDSEYEVYSETYITITGATNAQIDSGDLLITMRVQATRMTGESADEFRLGMFFHDGSGTLIGTATSDVLGASDGLSTNTWVEFSRTFALPANTRKFRYRIIAIKRNSVWNHARLEFYNPRGLVVLSQLTPFADTHIAIVDQVSRDYWGLTNSDIDVEMIQLLKINNLGTAGYYDQSPSGTRLDWTRKFLADIMASPTYSPYGKFSAAQIRQTPAIHDVLAQHIAGPASSFDTPTQHKVRTLDYARNYTLQNADTLAGNVDADTAAFVSLEYRSIREAAAGMSEALGAIESETQTSFYDLTGAQREAIRQLALLSPLKTLWRFQLTSEWQLKIRICDVVRITYPRWRFTTTRVGIVLQITEESKENRTTILWWG